MNAMPTPAVATGSRRRPSSWAVLVTILGLSVVGAIGLVDAERLDAGVVGAVWLSVAAAVWFAFGLILLTVVVLVQRYERRPLSLILLALAWGGLATTWIAGRAHLAIDTVLSNGNAQTAWTTWGTAPPIEESLKALGIVLVILVPVLRRSSALDGAFIGAVVGVGFQVVEDMVFTIPSMETQVDDPGGALVTMVFLRGVIGVFSHVVYSALMGAALGWFVGLSRGRTARDVLIVVGTYVGVCLLHGSGNWASMEGQIAAYLAISAVGLVLLIVVLRRARRAEDQRLTAWATGPGAGQVPPSVQDAFSAVPGTTRKHKRAALRAVAEAESAALAGSSAMNR